MVHQMKNDPRRNNNDDQEVASLLFVANFNFAMEQWQEITLSG